MVGRNRISNKGGYLCEKQGNHWIQVTVGKSWQQDDYFHCFEKVWNVPAFGRRKRGVRGSGRGGIKLQEHIDNHTNKHIIKIPYG